ncbi:MAG: diaminopimelate decarboxylase, partial [Actinomycetota bacterium]|nr:diaminopimelate decarboxylase [Actinomycetota bacterium]
MDPLFPVAARVSGDGHLVIGDCDTTELAERFGTPLIVYDRPSIEVRIAAYTRAIPPARVYYACKAFC